MLLDVLTAQELTFFCFAYNLNMQLTPKIRFRLFNANIDSTLSFGHRTWKMTPAVTRRLRSFRQRLGHVICLFCFDIITNEEHRRCRDHIPVNVLMRMRKWQ